MVALTTHLIDWLTLRLPISPASHPAIYARLADCIGHLVCSDATGEVKWIQRTLDIEALRSDSPGLYWQIKSDGKTDLLVIAASPASLEHGLNVWGTLDIRHAAETLIANASRCLQLVLPGIDRWQARRIDVTANYALPDVASVKHALIQLLVTTGARRRPSSKKGGDTVYWNFSSDLSKGKAYHKGPQVLFLWKKNKVEVDQEQLDLALFAVDCVREHGGVLEHPEASSLWTAAGLPRPGGRDAFGGWTLPVSQKWWGHRAEKRTWLYVVGIEPRDVPSFPFTLGEASHVVCLFSGRDRATFRPSIGKAEREHTPPDLALWLVDLARKCERAA